MLSLKNVDYKTPPPSLRKVLEGVSFTAEEGTNTVVFGDNGSGKTTLLRLLLKLSEPSSGSVCGGTEKASAFFEDVESQLFFTRVQEELQASGRKGEIYENCLHLLQLKKIIGRSTIELSYSQKARVALACAYMAERPFIIIDSPPRDEFIYRTIKFFSRQDRPSHLLLLPEGEESMQFKNFRTFKICRRQIIEKI